MAKDVTMRDIAKKVGVSTVTVSKALTDKEGVSSELRSIIIKTAEEMDYHYVSNDSGKNYGTTIGVIVADNYVDYSAKNFTFYMKMYHSIIKYMSSYRCSVIMEVINDEMLKEGRIPNMVQGRKVDGVIVLGYIESRYLNNIKKTCIPMVYLDFYDRNMEVASIISDNTYGTYMVTNYLFEMGHKKIAFVGNIEATPSILDRYLGFYRSFLNNKMQIRQEYVLSDRDIKGYDIDIELPQDMPTAFVCNCDQTAERLIRQLKRLGYSVPDDISVVGYDNFSLSRDNIKITTIEVDIDEMAKNALDVVARLINGDEKAVGRKVISGKLVIGDSVRNIK